MGRDGVDEVLAPPADLRDWFASSGVEVTATLGPADATRVRAVREALDRAVFAARAGTPPSVIDVTLLNDVAGDTAPEPELRYDGTVRRSASVAQALTAIIQDGFELLARGDAARLRECANPHCRRLFLADARTAVAGVAACTSAVAKHEA